MVSLCLVSDPDFSLGRTRLARPQWSLRQFLGKREIEDKTPFSKCTTVPEAVENNTVSYPDVFYC